MPEELGGFTEAASCALVVSGLAELIEERAGRLWSYEERRRGNDSIYIYDAK